MITPKLILFDFDGTLADSRASILTTYQATINELGLAPRSDEQCRATIGVPLKNGFEQLYPDKSAEEIQHIMATYRRIYKATDQQSNMKLFPGVADTLRRIHDSGIRMTVASSRTTDSIEDFCRHIGIENLFEMIVGADKVTRHKPDPETVTYTLDRLGIAPSDALVVGDMPVDIEMGKGAGCTTVGVSYGNSNRAALEQAGATFVIDHFPELLKVISL